MSTAHREGNATFRSSACITTLLLLTAPAFADADQCKDVLIHAVFDKLEITKDTNFFLSYISDDKTEQESQDQQSETLFASFYGITGGLSTDDKHYLRQMVSQHTDLKVIYQNRTQVLMQSGQPKIIDAWTQCMLTRGGGVSVYFTQVPGHPTWVDLNIRYFRGEGWNLPDLKLVSDVYLDPTIFAGPPKRNAVCLRKDFKLHPGDDACVVRLETVSASTEIVEVAVTDGKNRKGFTAYLAPRLELVSLNQSWPTPNLITEWQKSTPHPPVGVSGINTLSYYGDDQVGPQSRTTDINQNCHPPEDRWFFLESKRRPSPINPAVTETDFTHVGIRVGAQGAPNRCALVWRISPDKKQLCIGGGYGVDDNPNEQYCYLSLLGTMMNVSLQPATNPRMPAAVDPAIESGEAQVQSWDNLDRRYHGVQE